MNAVNYGPLKDLVADWYGDRGESTIDGEAIEFEEVLSVRSAGLTVTGGQSLATCRYERKALHNGNIYHQEQGYFLWDSERNYIYRQAVVPRGHQYVGESKNGKLDFSTNVIGISETDWLAANFKLLNHDISISIEKGLLSYSEEMIFVPPGKVEKHTLRNTLISRPVKI